MIREDYVGGKTRLQVTYMMTCREVEPHLFV